MQTFRTPSATWVSGQTSVEELVLQDELAGALDQHPQDLECLGVEADRPGRLLEALVGAVEPEAVEVEHGLAVYLLTAL